MKRKGETITQGIGGVIVTSSSNEIPVIPVLEITKEHLTRCAIMTVNFLRSGCHEVHLAIAFGERTWHGVSQPEKIEALLLSILALYSTEDDTYLEKFHLVFGSTLKVSRKMRKK
jgi:hypothetical protein